ncbi:hypothetical protein C2G38_2098655 [Gigaspora rosea]|uniref:Uncharacterized protein n=1 Tax=Gigaspora rosea TaxID=44941 RepID=A0A397UVW3_9GLOM|nr:hypothetical protein C2G38_2098655 [Gigaspora rosea]
MPTNRTLSHSVPGINKLYNITPFPSHALKNTCLQIRDHHLPKSAHMSVLIGSEQ